MALLIVVLKSLALTRNDGRSIRPRAWAKISPSTLCVASSPAFPGAIRDQLGAIFRLGRGVIGQTLAMEGMFAFFSNRRFWALPLRRKRFGRACHFLGALMRFIGSWLSGYFIIATNAWMQHPVGHVVASMAVHLDDFRACSSIGRSTSTIWAALSSLDRA
jgi:cytochrome d ubiquinol oxidase subunit I